MSDIHFERAARGLLWLVVFVSIGTIALHCFANAATGGNGLWDDSYMFVRYAQNLLAHGTVSWNDSTPTFGLTSQAYLLLFIPLVALVNNEYVIPMLASLISVAFFLAAIPVLVSAVVPRVSPLARLVSVASAYAFVALAAHTIGTFATSGMDTFFAIACLSLYLAFLFHSAHSLRSLSLLRRVLVGVSGGLMYLVRPDLIVFPLVIVCFLTVLSKTPAERRNAAIMLLVSLATLGMLAVCLWAYYGTPLPLPFYAKSTALYGPTIWRIFRFQPELQLLTYIDAYKVFFFGAILLAAAGWRSVLRRGADAVLVGTYAALALSFGYFLFFVLHVMGYAGRFYYPTLPPLLALTAFLIAATFERYTGPSSRRQRVAIAAGIACMLLVMLYSPFMWGAQRAAYTLLRERHEMGQVWLTDHLHDADFMAHHDSSDIIFPCLYAFASLPKDASVATTEVGLSSVIAKGHYMLDLAGLNATEVALGKVNAQEMIERQHIDIVYLPVEQYYPELRANILDSRAFTDGEYEVFLRGNPLYADIAIRKGSPYEASLRACISHVLASNPPAARAVVENSLYGGQYYYLTFPYPLD